ncbi:UNVERIFIED_CONTAM: hypothetical protein FKN15_032080 [Acipenser sinensis]
MRRVSSPSTSSPRARPRGPSARLGGPSAPCSAALPANRKLTIAWWSIQLSRPPRRTKKVPVQFTQAVETGSTAEDKATNKPGMGIRLQLLSGVIQSWFH